MCYAFFFYDAESGLHFIDVYVTREHAWDAMRECDSLGIPAGFPFPVDKHGKALSLAEMLATF